MAKPYFDIVMFYILWNLVSLNPPLQWCLLVLVVIAGRGIDRLVDIIPSIRYNTKPYILV